jgi:hypothetical protein
LSPAQLQIQPPLQLQQQHQTVVVLRGTEITDQPFARSSRFPRLVRWGLF